MGKKGKWFSLKKAFRPKSKEKKNQKLKEQFLEKQVHLDPSVSDSATLKTVKLSPRPRPDELKFIKAEVEPSKQTYADDAVAPAATA